MTPAPTYQVRADIVDIRQHIPKATGTYLVDTNAWKWVAYTKASLPTTPPPQATSYPQFIRMAKANGARLMRCGLSLSELANLIERQEFSEYARAQNLPDSPFERKKFRRSGQERAKVTAEIATAWSQVAALSESVTVVVNEATTNSCLGRVCGYPIDAYDAFILEAAQAAGINDIVSDDTDLCTVANIRLFTSHPGVITSAKILGRYKIA